MLIRERGVFMNICVYGASSNRIRDIFLDSTYMLGAQMAKRGHGLVFGGGNGGVMGSTARGVYDNGGTIIGVAPTFFKVDGVLFPNCTELIYTETMRDRKEILENRADAFIVAPGGIGTFDEFFEMYTLKQLGRHAKAIAIYNVDGYYDHMIEMLKITAREEFMGESSLDLFKVFDDIDEMLSWIENYEGKLVNVTEVKHINLIDNE